MERVRKLGLSFWDFVMYIGLSFSELLKYFWVFQAFQIPIVLFVIILLLYGARKINHSEFGPTGELFDKPQVSYFYWVGIGFIFHLLYLCVHLDRHISVVSISMKASLALEGLSDMLSTSLFFLASLRWFIVAKMKPDREMKAARERRGLLVAFILLFLAAFGYVSVENYKRIYDLNEQTFSLGYFLYDLFVYLPTGMLLFEAMGNNTTGQSHKGKYFVAGGFIGWSIIQLFRPAGQLWGFPQDAVDLFGFTFSTVVKLSIFYGFFNYFISMARNAIVRNERALKENADRLKELQRFTKEISAATMVKEIKTLLEAHLIQSDLFQFDYIKFSKVDYLKHRIIHFTGAAKKTDYQYFAEDGLNTDLELNDKDITALCIRTGYNFLVSGDTISGVKVNLNDPNCPIDKHHYRRALAANLIRLLIPVIDHTKRNAEQSPAFLPVADRKVGVLEVGYRKREPKAWPKANDTERDLLEIYADNFAQSIYRLSQEELTDRISSILMDSDKKSGDDENEYLSRLLEHVCGFIHVDEGFVKLLSFNESEYRKEAKSAVYSRQGEPSKHVPFEGCSEQLIARCMALGELCTFANEAIVPIHFEGRILGFAEFYSQKKDFFNEQNLQAINNIFKDVGSVYASKKFHRAVKTQTYTYIDLLQVAEILEPVISSIRHYFICDLISVWLPNYSSDPETYEQPLLHSFRFVDDEAVFGQGDKLIRPTLTPLDQIKEYAIEAGGPPELVQFGAENNVKSLIHISLLIDKKQYGFINIYSRRPVDVLFSEDRQLLLLIANKCAIALTTSAMIGGFSRITQSIANNEHVQALREIAALAGKILQSDPVVLFLLDDEGKIKYDNVISSGNVVGREKLLSGNDKATFVDISVKHGSYMFYEQEADLPETYNVKDGFWVREKIRSLAVCPLKHDDRDIGIMFFNYRGAHEFSAPTRQLINALSTLATTAIVHAENIAEFKRQQAELAEKYSNSLVAVNKLLPATDLDALGNIVQTVSHDLRHTLTSIAQNLLDIQTDFTDKRITDNNKTSLVENIALVNHNINNANDLMVLFEPKSFKIAYLDLYEIGKKVVSMFPIPHKNTSGIKIVMERPEGKLEKMRCLRAELSLVVYNLVLNARNAIIDDWKKHKKTTVPEGDITIRAGATDGYETIEVEDDGPGIDKKDYPKIYNPGFSARGGTGLGLYHVKNIVENAYLGKIGCETKVGKGTTFTIRLKQRIDLS